MEVKILTQVPPNTAGNIVTFHPGQIINVDINYAKELVGMHVAEYYISKK